MGYNFKECNRDQTFLLPPSLKEWLPKDDLAWFILDTVSQMNLENIYRKYRDDGSGGSSYDPGMMVSLMLYGYSLGQRSSRVLEKLCERDIGFRVVSANAQPDHSTICRFRQGNEKELAELFNDILRLCAEAGLVKVGLVALDGTKIKANAALAANRTNDHLREEIRKWFAEADAIDAEEDRLYDKDKRGDELPEELRDPESRLRRLQECKKRLDEKAAAAKEEQRKKLKQREAEEAASGEAKRGRKPREPEEMVNDQAKANVTDPESRIMKNSKGYVQGYNAQAMVTKDQIIVAAELTQEENDRQQLKPLLKKTKENLRKAGVKEKPATCVADAGYWSEDNVKDAKPTDPELYIATLKDWRQRAALKNLPPPRGRIPEGISEQDLMERKLRTKRGQALYKQRSILPEPVFGQIKDGRGIDHFLRRGLEACASEWKLISATHNLLKLFRHSLRLCPG